YLRMMNSAANSTTQNVPSTIAAAAAQRRPLVMSPNAKTTTATIAAASRAMRSDAPSLVLIANIVRLFIIFHQPGDVLAHDVEFEIHDRSHTDAAEIGVLVRIRDDRNAETARLRVADREAHAVHGYGSLLHGAQSAALRFVLEGEIPASAGILHGGADCRLVHVALNDMTVEQRIGFH